VSLRAIFVRHGESVSNAHPSAAAIPAEQGDRLTEHGRRQALAAGRALQAYAPSEILTSPMRRARETAEAINRTLNLPVTELPYIHELGESRDYASFTPEEQKLRRWSAWMAAHADDPGYSWEGGESFNDVRGRVRRLKQELERRPPPAQPVVVSHGLFLRFFLFDSLLADEFKPALVERMWFVRSLNGGISLFEHGERWHPVDADTPGWTCISWMSRPWDP
jgi:probable phosphoglycerate mutase